MKQPHDMEVVHPLLPQGIPNDIKDKALGYLMFLEEKINGEIKGRSCADPNPDPINPRKGRACLQPLPNPYLLLYHWTLEKEELW